METINKESLKIQSERLKDTVKRVYENIPIIGKR